MDPFVAEIRIFPFNFPPTGWATCDGQLLPLSQNTALFSLLGTTYGGDGKSNFALPDLQGRSPVQPGQGPGLSLYDLGQSAGEETVTLLQTEIPMHSHTVNAKLAGTAADPNGLLWGNPGGRPAPNFFATAQGTAQNMNPSAVSVSGGSQPHNSLMPYLTLNFCIALQGVFPPRS
ncbi:phage tail protein [Flavisolibacter ginsenosidimutans]|uniref:Phage tail protein n=1 Tax=Flavisolibacter ginsenosidimutans TaxID=661481 RepID=A0A5B8UNY1_9BACT|nr:tail fiber protein [Flavisolibacter ginsenosidimutans]QEC57929.1 phage tail protein [Flavisolibacter ginsenosidimutans]